MIKALPSAAGFLVVVLCAFPLASNASYARSKAALRAFVKEQACPATGAHRLPCPGYVIDHIKALACGGADDPSNMQWQTREEAKAKDRWELKECGK
jgi:hypothetical protein